MASATVDSCIPRAAASTSAPTPTQLPPASHMWAMAWKRVCLESGNVSEGLAQRQIAKR